MFELFLVQEFCSSLKLLKVDFFFFEFMHKITVRLKYVWNATIEISITLNLDEEIYDSELILSLEYDLTFKIVISNFKKYIYSFHLKT